MEWYSVKEQLPKPDDIVLVYIPRFLKYGCLRVREARLHNILKRWIYAYGLLPLEEVTHWAYMPSPPEEEAGG